MAKSPQQSKRSKGSKKGSKGSKDSKKAPKAVEPLEEPEVVVPVPEGVMHKRMRFLLESTLKTDVDFIVGPQGAETTIKAHKCMLAAESPIFEKLFANCQEWKDAQVRKQEQAVLEIRQREAEVEAELAKQAERRNANEAAERSRPKSKSKGSKGKGKGGKAGGKRSKTKEGSPTKAEGAEKSKTSESKTNKKESGSKKSKGKESKSKGSKKSSKENEEGPVARISFHQDEVIGPDTIRVQDVHPQGFFQLLRWVYDLLHFLKFLRHENYQFLTHRKDKKNGLK